MASQGPLAPTSQVSTGAGGEPWVNPAFSTPSDDQYATASLTLFTSSFSDDLDDTAFSFAIPPSATINGIVVEVERRSDAGEVFDLVVQLIKGGVASGDNKADGAPWPGGDTTQTYGSSSDLWGLAWTPADINAGTFGVRVQCFNPNFDVVPDTGYVDDVRITVHYTAGGGAPPLPLLGVGG